jgi:hypothetical protein
MQSENHNATQIVRHEIEDWRKEINLQWIIKGEAHGGCRTEGETEKEMSERPCIYSESRVDKLGLIWRRAVIRADRIDRGVLTTARSHLSY